MEVYNDIGASGTAFGTIFLLVYVIIIIAMTGIGIYVLILLIKFLKAGTKAFHKYLNEDE